MKENVMSKVAALKESPRESHIHTGIKDEERKKLADALGGVLADTWVLLVKTQGFHWNVVGPHFYGLHKLTEEHYEDLFAALDDLGERIRALGHFAPQSLSEVSELSSIKEQENPAAADKMIHQLIDNHEKIVRRLRNAAEHADSAGDKATDDLLTQRLEKHEEAIWMLRAIVSE
jgi:starvation-inducible DNA-binding protein